MTEVHVGIVAILLLVAAAGGYAMGFHFRKKPEGDVPDDVVEGALRTGIEAASQVATLMAPDEFEMRDAQNDDYRRGWDDAINAYRKRLAKMPIRASVQRVR